MSEERDPKDPRWLACRYAAYKRDNFKCVLCSRNEGLNGHHIIRWVDAPKLRYLTSNVVTLCEDCHKSVTGHEHDYEEQFQRIIAMKMGEQRVANKKSKGQRINTKYRPRNPF
jgi:5-methylcytosine-specific restriction endonuclease McrA